MNTVLTATPKKVTNEQVDSVKLYITRSGASLQFAQLEDGRIGIFAVKNCQSVLLLTTTQESFKETYLGLTAK